MRSENTSKMTLKIKIKIITYILLSLVVGGLSVTIMIQKGIINNNKNEQQLLTVEIEKLNNEIEFKKKNVERIENFSNSSEKIKQIKNEEMLNENIKTSIDAVVYDFYKHSLSNNY